MLLSLQNLVQTFDLNYCTSQFAGPAGSQAPPARPETPPQPTRIQN